MLSTHLKQLAGLTAICGLMSMAACGAGRSRQSDSVQEDTVAETAESAAAVPVFSADSAMSYLKRQVDFGPRVPNSEAHRQAADWIASELRRHGAQVHEQSFSVKAFDGTELKARNIFGRFNPEQTNGRLLLLAHYDTRPWADQDPDPANRTKPLDGANDGASGVAVLLETARQLAASNPGKGIDILFVDVEDYGTDGDDTSWALGARHFAEKMDAQGWRPDKAILLDMVGGQNARFPYEYFSQQHAPDLNKSFRDAASAAGFSDRFPNSLGGAVTDDHVQLIEQGVKAIDIIEYNPNSGFNPTWHTMADNIANIDPQTLRAVGQSLLQYIYQTSNP